MNFREIVPEDVPQLFMVRTATDENNLSLETLHLLGITEESVRQMIASTHKGWLCETEGRIVGFAMGNRTSGELWVIAVLPGFIKRGIGTELLRRVEDWLFHEGCVRLWLTTDIDTSLRAYTFFLNNGWRDDKIEDGMRYMRKVRLPFDLRTVEIPTRRLLLRPITREYDEIIFREFTDEITHYMFPKPSENIEGVRGFITSAMRKLEAGIDLQTVILDKSTLEFLGCAALHAIGRPDPELGVWVRKSAHGRKIGLEAVTGLVDWARKNISFDHLRYPVDRRNVSSRRIAEANAGIVRTEYRKPNEKGFELDEVEYWIPLRSPEPVMRPITDDEIAGSVDVVRRAFSTVAEEFGLTSETAPTHPAFWTRERLLELRGRGATLFGLFTGGRQCGFVAVEKDADGAYLIEKLAVAPEARHHGYGEALMEHAFSHIRNLNGRRVRLSMMDEHRLLKDWYKSQGFRETEVLRFPHLPFAVCHMQKDVD
jgi:GNAT superfamily N-acetyltransferase